MNTTTEYTPRGIESSKKLNLSVEIADQVYDLEVEQREKTVIRFDINKTFSNDVFDRVYLSNAAKRIKLELIFPREIKTADILVFAGETEKARITLSLFDYFEIEEKEQKQARCLIAIERKSGGLI